MTGTRSGGSQLIYTSVSADNSTSGRVGRVGASVETFEWKFHQGIFNLLLCICKRICPFPIHFRQCTNIHQCRRRPMVSRRLICVHEWMSKFNFFYTFTSNCFCSARFDAFHPRKLHFHDGKMWPRALDCQLPDIQKRRWLPLRRRIHPEGVNGKWVQTL